MTKYTKKINNEIMKAYNGEKRVFIQKVDQFFYACIEGVRAYQIHEDDTPFRETFNPAKISDFFTKEIETVDAVITAEKRDIPEERVTVVKIKEIEGDRYAWVNEKFIKGFDIYDVKLCKEKSNISPIYAIVNGCRALFMPMRCPDNI